MICNMDCFNCIYPDCIYDGKETDKERAMKNEEPTYYERNREKCLAKANEYNHTHVEQRKAYYKEYYRKHAEEKKAYRRRRHKETYISKKKGEKSDRAEYYREYYRKNRERYLQRYREKVCNTC